MSLTTRAGKGSALTWDELDANFSSIEGNTLVSTDIPEGYIPVADGSNAVEWRTGATSGASGRTYYLCNTTASDIAGYMEAPIQVNSGHTQTTISSANTGTSFTTREEFATLVGEPAAETIPSGMFYAHVHAATDATNAVAQLKVLVYSRTTGGTETLIATATSRTFSGTTPQELTFNATVLAPVAIAATDRLVFKVQTARVSGPTTVTTTLYFEGTDTAGFVITPLVGASTTNLTIIDEGGYYSSTNVEDALQEVAARDVGFRNRIINGDMRIDQRNAGAAVTYNSAAFTYCVDRWKGFGQAADGVFTLDQSTTSPPEGFTHFLRATVTTADASIAAGQVYLLTQIIEGNHVADLDWGLSTAKTITLSFRVRSSVTGTFSGSLLNSAANRTYPFTYVINAANTWETKTITITGDTTGTWLTDTGIGVYVNFSLGMGSTYSGTASTWAAALYYSATGATNLIATLNATLDITGVQFEVGSVATPFERRPYTTELTLCQRYYYKMKGVATNSVFGNGFAYNSTLALITIYPPVTMRTRPTALETHATATNYTVDIPGGTIVCSVVPAYGASEAYVFAVNATVAAGFTAGWGVQLRQVTTANGYLAWSAEL